MLSRARALQRPSCVGSSVALRLLPSLCNSVLETIGKTPLDRLWAALGLSKGTTIFAKLGHLNPGMSKKDRIAYEIIRRAKRNGDLQERHLVVELTPGNTRTGWPLCVRS